MKQEGAVAASGDVSFEVIRADGTREKVPRSEPSGATPLRVVKLAPKRMTWRELWALIRDGLPSRSASVAVNAWRIRNLRHLQRGIRRVLLAKAARTPTFFGALYLRVLRADGSVEELGLASLQVVTTAGVNFLVDALQGIVEPEILKFHGIGTGTNAEASADTALQTELTTQYNPDNTRATGSLTEGASANIFRTVGTNTIDSGTPAVTEHGIFSQAATGGGTLLDRSVFSAINLAAGDGLQSTYDLTLNAGG